MNKEIKIKGRYIGENCPCYIIAEISANHGGKFDNAIKLIHAAKEAGVDCVKLQTYTADTITMNSDKSPFQLTEGTWKGYNLYKLYQEAFTPWEWQSKLKEEIEKLGMDFLSTAYDNTAVDFLEELGIKFYKIASFELIDLPLIKYIAEKNKPIIMSTGMGRLEEIKEAVNTVKEVGNENLCLLKCSSAYPASLDNMNLKTMNDIGKRFGTIVGLSDHSLGTEVATTAVCLGAKVIEKHICLDRKFKTPDSSFSMEPKEFKKLVEDIRKAEKIIGKVSYELSEAEKINRGYRKSIFAIKDIKKGEKFSNDNIKIIRPGDGLKPKYYDYIIGKVANINIQVGTPINNGLIKN
jgi:pseudaminic acid synthase